MGAPRVVLIFPLTQLLGELAGASDNHPAVELVRVRPVAAFHLPSAFRTAAWDVPVRDAEISQVPREVGTELGAMIGLNSLNGHRESAADRLDELSGRLDGGMGVDAKDPIPGGFIDRYELIEPAPAEFEMFDVDLDRLPRDVKLTAPPRPWTIPL